MKALPFSILLGSLIIAMTIIVFAPYIGLGANEEFFLWEWFHLSRGVALSYPAAVAFMLCVFQALTFETVETRAAPGVAGKLKVAWMNGSVVFQQFIGTSNGAAFTRESMKVAGVFLLCGAVFGVLINKDIGLFESGVDQHWHQALVEYDVQWRTPILQFAGNVMHQMGIQLPLNTQLLPFSGLAQLFPRQSQIFATVTLTFVGMVALFWAVGVSFGLRPVARAVFSGLIGLITTVPAGLDAIFWLLPPNFFTSQFTLALWWQEAPILALATVLAFYWIGNCGGSLKNVAAALSFLVGSFSAVLSYPVGAVYFIPIIALYCAGLLITSASYREATWKIAVGALAAGAILALGGLQFFKNLYAYTYGAYFFDAIKMSTAGLFRVNFMVTLHGVDFRGLIVFVFSFAALFCAALKGEGGLRRFAIAALICESGIILMGSVNAIFFHAALGFGYAEIAHSPMWGAYFVLTCMVLMRLVDLRLSDHASEVLKAAAFPKVRWMIERRYIAYTLALSLGLIVYATTSNRLQRGFQYPPATPSVVKAIEGQIQLAPGTPYRGTSFTLFEDPGLYGVPPSVASYKYRLAFDNDLIIDLPADSLPSIYQHAHWTSPITFAFLRSFFGRSEDSFDKAYYILRNYDPKIARLMGIRVVVTDDKSFADGSLIYRQVVGASELRVMQIDNINLGQYSPTRLQRVDTAAEAVAALKRQEFDPVRDVVIEQELPSGLVPADAVSVVVDYGPTLAVRAKSTGHSLIVLPFEYSHCLRLEAPAASNARLVPVNLQQIGLMFDNSVEARITYRFGLLKDAACRGEDVARADRLRLREIVSWPQ